jgi:PAS domain S-box-containing protein
VFVRARNEVTARPALWVELPHPADCARAAALLARARRGETVTGQYRIMRADGATRWVEEEIVPILADGRAVRLAGTVTDITERHEADRQLPVFRGLIEAATDVFYIVRPADDFRLVFVNEAGERHFGRPVAELMQLHMWDLDREFTAEACQVFWTQLKEQGVALFESNHRRADGTVVRVEVATSYVRHGDDELIAGYFRDVSSRVHVAAVLHEREERLREQATLLDEASDAIILRGLDGAIRFWNRGAERLFGWTRDEAAGRKPEDLFFRGSQPEEAATRAVLAHGMWNGEIEHLTRAGARILVESRWTLIRNSTGEPRAILTINTDITEKRHVEANLLRAQRLESIGTLAGGIAHDLNNILAPIILSGDMLRPRFVGTPDEELIDTICASARRGADVVRQVLSFARGVESTRVPVNLRHLLPEIRKIVRETFRRDITCTTEAPYDLWTIHADPTQVHQVLLNLCINAADAMPRGGTLRIDAGNIELGANLPAGAPEARPGLFVRVRVTDTGSGIPENIRHRIFDPFFTTKGVGKGTGLGLSTALAIVRGHGGFISVDTTVGHGTTFALYLPAEAVAVPAQPAVPAHDLPRGLGELVLVIDDEQSVRTIVRQSLESVGYRVLMAGDGEEGLSLFERHRAEIVLVLTDLMMPVMGGLVVIKTLQECAPAVRIIAMSGVTEFSDDARPTVPAGAVGFLLKPFTLETLLKTVRGTLDAPAGAVIR